MTSRARLFALLVGGLLLLRPLGAQQDAADRLLGEARRLDREGKVDEARNEYELLVQRFPDSYEADLAKLALAESYWRAGEADRAEKLLDSISNDALAGGLRLQRHAHEQRERRDPEQGSVRPRSPHRYSSTNSCARRESIT